MQSIEQLAFIFENNGRAKTLTHALQNYEKKLFREIDFLDTLIDGWYCSFWNFDLLNAFTMYYFIGAIYSEAKRRNNQNYRNDEFIYSQGPALRDSLFINYKTIKHYSENRNNINKDKCASLVKSIRKEIAPYNLAGLCDPGKRNMYPFISVQQLLNTKPNSY